MSGADTMLLRKWLVDGNAEAFDEIVRRHADMVYGTSRRILRDRSDAEDVVQDCFLRLAEAAGDIRTSLGGWLHAAAVSRSLDLIKRESRRRARERQFVQHTSEHPEITWSDVEEYIDEAIAALPAEIRDPVVAHFLERQTHEAIAREAGIPRRTVSHRIGRGVDAIRTHLERRGILAGTMTLTAVLTGATAEGAPATLTTALGKIAMSGIRHGATGGLRALAVSGGSVTLGKGLAVVAIVLVVAGAVVLAARNRAESGEGIPPALRRPAAVAAALPPPDQPSTPLAPTTAPSEPAPAEPPSEPGLIEDPASYIAVSGTVKDGKDQPVAGARVLLAVTGGEGKMYENLLGKDYLKRSKVYEAAADAQGHYEIFGVRYEGQVMVCAVARDFAGNGLQFDVKAGESYTDKDLDLTPGITVQGALSAEDGSMITDAIVSTVQAWNRSGYAWGWGFNVTDEHGLFTLSFAPEAQWCTLRANSESLGQDYFVRLPVGSGNFELRMKPKASLHGTIAWNGERPEEDVVVSVLGSIPEPDMHTVSTGMRPEMLETALVGADDTYSLSGLYPGLEYRFYLTANEPGKHPSIGKQYARIEHPPLVFEPGENRELNQEVGEPITVHGRVLTEKSRQPVPNLTLQVKRAAPEPASFVGAAHVEQDGTFTYRSPSGPGTYVFEVMVLGPSTSEFRERLAQSSGAKLQLAAGETRETEILIPEPVPLTVRVVDHNGSSPENVEIEVHIICANGEEGGTRSYVKLDESGRYTFSIYEPIREVWVDVRKGMSDGMAVTESTHYLVTPGETPPELLVELEPTCTLTGILRDAEGTKLAGQWVVVKAEYEDGTTGRVSLSIDQDGRFEGKDGFRTGVVTFSIKSDLGTWSADPIDCAPDDTVDLGEVYLNP